MFGKRRSSFSTRTKVRLTLVSEGLAGTAYAWIFFSDGMLDRTSGVTEGTDDTYTMFLQGRESATPTRPRRQKPTVRTVNRESLAVKVDDSGTCNR